MLESKDVTMQENNDNIASILASKRARKAASWSVRKQACKFKNVCQQENDKATSKR